MHYADSSKSKTINFEINKKDIHRSRFIRVKEDLNTEDLQLKKQTKSCRSKWATKYDSFSTELSSKRQNNKINSKPN